MGAYLESKLEPDEQIIYRARKHPLPALLMAAILLGAVLLIKHYPSNLYRFLSEIFDEGPLFVTFSLIILISSIFFVKFLLEYFQSDLALTDRRVIGRQPYILRLYEFKYHDIPLAQIETAMVDRTSGLSYDASGSILGLVAVFFGLIFMNPLVYRLVGIGDVLIVDKEGNTTRLSRLSLPDKFCKELQELIGERGKAASASPSFKFNWIMGVGIGLFVVSILALGLLILKYKP